MVAPTRTPQARGIKCDLCKKILNLATWLDQTKLAKSVKDATTVLRLIKQHDTTDCPCIPDSIKNLLVGSTHFEIHRLNIKSLDLLVGEKHHDSFAQLKQTALLDQKRRLNENINDFNDRYKTRSRFKTPPVLPSKIGQLTEEHIKHLSKAIDFWKIALEDQANPFNSKLALRLGLTHHVIYGCYLYKYYKIYDYQLISADLLLNLFKSIEGVTANAIIHASYILIKTLIDCNQLNAARQYLKQAKKSPNYQDKSHYESILLTCAECELDLLECDNNYDTIEELAKLAIIKPDDKLQHYYARTLALATVIRYIHCYPARSDLCYEFYHTFRFSCAIIRRCYDSCFELVLSEKEANWTNVRQQTPFKQNQILDHSWIRYAVCDFVFSTFDLISSFFLKSGQPETLELLYNGLNLVAYRSGSCYWQTKMATIGINLDLICDKYDEARAKVSMISHVIKGAECNQHLMNLLRLKLEISSLSIDNQQNLLLQNNNDRLSLLIRDLLGRIKYCFNCLQERIHGIELYDCKSTSSSRLSVLSNELNSYILTIGLRQLCLKVLKIGVTAMLRVNNVIEAKDLMNQLSIELKCVEASVLEYYDCQTILETILCFTDIYKSELILIESIQKSQVFLKMEDNFSNLLSGVSSLTLDSDKVSTIDNIPTTPNSSRRKMKIKKKIARRRKGVYDVACRSEENLLETQGLRLFGVIEAARNFSTLTKEEIIVTYLRNSEPNPDYDLYRRSHELLLSFKLLARDDNNQKNNEQLLYHFNESTNSNTIRYRWMMYKEQQVSPFDPQSSSRNSHDHSNYVKHLSFANSSVNTNKVTRSMIQSIGNDTRLIQLKFVMDTVAMTEHLLIACFENKQEPFFVHTMKPITNDDFLSKDDLLDTSLPSKIQAQIEEGKKTLFMKNQRDKTDKRKSIESQLSVLLHDFENDWLGPFRFVFAAGKINNTDYDKLVQIIIKEIGSTMAQNDCISESALRVVVENGPLLSRDEFCQLLSLLYNCDISCDEVKNCFNFWLKTIEAHILERYPHGLSKVNYLLSLSRGQLGIILCKNLEQLPLESLPIVRIVKQGIFRVPSLRLFNIITLARNNSQLKVESDSTFYLLDPGNNLSKTRERFDMKLKAQKSWQGTIGQPPTNEELAGWLMTKEIYIYIGHGAGTSLYNKLCKGRGLSYMEKIKCVCIIMGCSSGRVSSEGPRLESFAIAWTFIFLGSPSYVGLMWDVTDTDIDKFLDALLNNWLKSKWTQIEETKSGHETVCITDAIADARQVCDYKFLIGSSPVLYGLPMLC